MKQYVHLLQIILTKTGEIIIWRVYDLQINNNFNYFLILIKTRKQHL